MIWRPTGVEPVNDTTSTSGCVVQLRADGVVRRREHVHDAGRDVGRLGDELAERERRPRRVGRALQHHRAAGRERGRELRERELDRVVVRRDRADDAGRFLLDPAVVPAREGVALAEVLDELVALEQIGVPAARRRSGRRAAARSCSRRARRPRARGSRAVARRCRAAPGAAGAGSARGTRGRATSRSCRTRAGPRAIARAGVVDGRVGGDAEHLLGRRARSSRRSRRPRPATSSPSISSRSSCQVISPSRGAARGRGRSRAGSIGRLR